MNFSGNTALIDNSASSNGGGVYSGFNSSMTMSGNTTFSNNSAFLGRGGKFIESFLNLEGNTSFTNCSATLGGAIYVRGSQANFSGTNVLNANRAAHLGGGLYAPESSLNFPGDNTFLANSVGSRGGSIYVQEVKLSFSGTGLFSGNVAQLDGGADGSNLSFSEDVTITNNNGQLSRGVYLDNNTFTLDGHNTVERNIATYYGGGIYTQRSLLSLLGNNTFITNSVGEGANILAGNRNISVEEESGWITAI